MSPLGCPRVHLRSTDSTNERARSLALAGAPHGTLVTASVQTAGRGRQGRRWSAPPGSSVLMSLLLRTPPALLPLIAAVAVCEAVDAGARIKWPNDIVVEGPGGAAKLAGILVEGRPQEDWAVLGIGLNVSVDPARMPQELQGRIASLELPPARIEPTLALVLGALEQGLRRTPGATLEAWRQRDALLGREIAWGSSGAAEERNSGRAEGIDGAGRLIVALPDGGRTALGAGEVHLVDPRDPRGPA